jgi:hypothetical protein
MKARDLVSCRVSAWLIAVAAVTSALSFQFWQIFSRDVPMGVGNMRGTALSMLVMAVPLVGVSMVLAARGSLRARFIWLGGLAYIAYNAVLFCFAAHFNSFFLLFTTLLGLSFWAMVTLLQDFDLDAVPAACAAVPARGVAVYMLVSLGIFAAAWLRDIVPAIATNGLPAGLEGTGLTQNPIYVLDFAFTFPTMVIGAVWLWQRRAWGYVVSAMMVIMLTVETAGIAVDQVFGHLHDQSAPLDAVPVMIGFTAAGLVASVLFLRGVNH